MRACEWCGSSIEHKRSDARFCGRSCKTRASDHRRIVDGRSTARDRARYPREAAHRRAYAKKYLKEHSEEMRLVRERRKGRIRGASFLFTERDWKRLVARYDHRCAYCFGRSARLERDHVIPLARGGTHGIGNILPACPPCNARKKTRLLAEFRYETKVRR